MSDECLYVFLDEGGNLDFSPSGTKFFSLTSVCKVRPFIISHILGKYKLDLIEYGLDFEYFHCTNNNKYVRDKVFRIIKDNIYNLRIDSLLVEKRKTGVSLQEVSQFYPRMLGYLLRYVMKSLSLHDFKEVIVITDKIPVNKKKDAIEKAVKITLKSMLPKSCKYRILHHPSISNIGLQLADYCNWAIFRKWECDDLRYYDEIKEGVKSEFDIFKNGVTHYY